MNSDRSTTYGPLRSDRLLRLGTDPSPPGTSHAS